MTNSMDGELMVYAPEGKFLMRSEYGWNHDQSKHTVYVDAFWIHQNQATNRQFADFVDVSGHQTLAEEVSWGYFDDETRVRIDGPSSSILFDLRGGDAHQTYINTTASHCSTLKM